MSEDNSKNSGKDFGEHLVGQSFDSLMSIDYQLVEEENSKALVGLHNSLVSITRSIKAQVSLQKWYLDSFQSFLTAVLSTEPFCLCFV